MDRESITKHVEGVVLQAFTWWMDCGLRDFGRFTSKDTYQLDDACRIWAFALLEAEVRLETLEPAARRIASEGGDFPDVGSFIAKCKELRSEMFKMVGIDLAPRGIYEFIHAGEFPRAMPTEECKAILRNEARAKGLQLAEHEIPALPGPERMVSTDDVRNHMAKALRGMA